MSPDAPSDKTSTAVPTWDCCCEQCSQTWQDVFPEDEEGVTCPFCDSEDFDAVRVADA